MARLLKAKNLSVVYKGYSALLKDANFQLNAGEHLGLSGKSGSGKTTLLRLCAGLYGTEASPVVSGYLEGNGLDLFQLSPKQATSYRTDFIGRVTEDPISGLHPQRTIEATLKRFGTSGQFLELLETFGVSSPNELIKRLPHQLSGGEAQRIRLAFALKDHPALLLMESPTASLDSITAMQVLTKVEEMVNQGLGVLHVSHDLALLDRVAHTRLHLSSSMLQGESPLIAQPTRTSLGMGETILECNQLFVKYESSAEETVRAISLSLRKGEILGLVGSSGSGKTSIGRALAGIIPASGSLYINGEKSAFAKTYFDRPNRKIQYVWQEPHRSLNPAFTVRKTLEEASRGQFLSLDVLLNQVALSVDYLDRMLSTLSTGEMQRVALARALSVKPDVLICDELLAGVDGEARASLQETLFQLTANSGLGIVYISHDLANIRGIADRVLILDKGEIVELSETKTLFTSPQSAVTRRLLEASGL